MPEAKEIGKRLKKLRKDKGYSQKDVANMANISISSIAMYETGERIPRDEVKIKLSRIFKKSVDSIFFKN
ncbi:MAG: helix-turn-helix transcriptional regulator [Cellulosilyticaceae bacterium]